MPEKKIVKNRLQGCEISVMDRKRRIIQYFEQHPYVLRKNQKHKMTENISTCSHREGNTNLLVNIDL